MNLCIDIGNTRTKVAVFDAEGSLIKLIIRDDYTSGKLDKVLKKYEIEHVIVSSVKKKQGKYKRLVGNKVKTFVELSHETPIPVTNLYHTPETLGKDRLAGVVGAYFLFPGNDVLVVDAGTCITYDIIDSEGNYYGGSILPGIEMRFKALNTFTARLPLVHRDLLESHIGDTTLTCIQTGIQFGVVYEDALRRARARAYCGINCCICVFITHTHARTAHFLFVAFAQQHIASTTRPHARLVNPPCVVPLAAVLPVPRPGRQKASSQNQTPNPKPQTLNPKP